MSVTGFTVHPETWRAPKPESLRLAAALEQTENLDALLGSHHKQASNPYSLPSRFALVGRVPFFEQPLAFTVPACLQDQSKRHEQELVTLAVTEHQQAHAKRQELRFWADRELTQTLQTHAPKLLNQLMPFCGYVQASGQETVLNAQMAVHLFGDLLTLRSSNLTFVLQTLSPVSDVAVRSLFAPHRLATKNPDILSLQHCTNNAKSIWHQYVYHEALTLYHLVLETNPLEEASIQLQRRIEQQLQTLINTLHAVRIIQAHIHLSLVSKDSPVGHWVLFNDALLGIPSGMSQLKTQVHQLSEACRTLELLLPSSAGTSPFLSQIDAALIQDLAYALQSKGDKAAEDVLAGGYTSVKQWYKHAHTFSQTKSLLSPRF
ncbi:TPA: hypothetical protein DEB00_01620 [Candidatus Uhrbacteria bacterium]|nr:hypothetical protein [Candidatus Uhrbacteria bacterium]